MFLELSCGLTHLDNINYIFRDAYGYHSIIFRGDKAFDSLRCSEEDVAKIRALSRGEQHHSCGRKHHIVIHGPDCSDA